MKIYIAQSEAEDRSHYLAAILHAFGLCQVEILPFGADLSALNPATDVLVVPARATVEEFDAFLRSGGQAVAVRPSSEITAAAGLCDELEVTAASRLRFSTSLCPGARGEPLWTPAPHSRWQKQQGDVLAYLYLPGQADSESAGILHCPVDEGNLTVFAYDPVECIIRLRQGNPEQANSTPAPSMTPRAAFLHAPGASHDALWRPTADLHAQTLCSELKRLLKQRVPIPTLWHLPATSPALLLFSGDEDGSSQEANHEQMAALEEHGGAMTLNVIQDATSITREKIAEYSGRGHTVSVHPNLVPEARSTLHEQIAKAEADVLAFQEKFDQSVRTLRNHCYMWPGYLELPPLWETLGVGMDFNSTSTGYGVTPEFGPYLNLNTAMPLPFVRQDGSLIDVYQQPTHLNDDLMCHPTKEYSQKYSPQEFKVIVSRMLEDATRLYHGTICANFHPGNFVDFSGEHGRILMRRACEMQIPIWSSDRWHNFWRGRASWRLSEYSWHAPRLCFLIEGEPVEQLSITLPLSFEGNALSTLRFAERELEFESVERFGERVAHAVFADGVQRAQLVAEYR